MRGRFQKTTKILDISITVVAAMLSVVIMLYGVMHFGLRETWLELLLNVFYIACLVMIWMYFFNRLDTQRFNYWCSISVGITVLLRDILYQPSLVSYPLHLVCFTLSVFLLCTLTYFYARKDWKSYTKRNLWSIFILDTLIAMLYHYDFQFLEVNNEYTDYVLIEIWIRPTITYGLVACFISEAESHNNRL